MGLLSVLDFHRLIEQDIQQLGFFVYDFLETEEIDLHLNREAYNLVNGILDKYFGRDLKIGPQQGFQVDQVSLHNLRKQHVKDDESTLDNFSNGKKADLPDDYYILIKAKVEISYKCIEGEVEVTKKESSKLRILDTEDIDELRKNPLHASTKESLIGEIAGDFIYIYTDNSFDIEKVEIDYIKKLSTIKFGKDVNGDYQESTSIQCDLDDTLHYMLQEMTSIKVLKIIEASQQKIVNLKQPLT